MRRRLQLLPCLAVAAGVFSAAPVAGAASPGVRVGPGPYAIAMATAGGRAYAYVTDSDANTVSVVDVARRRLVTRVTVGPNPSDIVASPDGRRVYVGLQQNVVPVVDTARRRVVARLRNPCGGFTLAISPDGRQLYASGGGNGPFCVIDVATRRVRQVATRAPGPFAPAPDGRRVYVGIFTPPFAVAAIDAGSLRQTGLARVRLNPQGMAVTPDGRRLVVANWGNYSNPFRLIVGHTVQVIDTASMRVVRTINVGLLPIGVAISARGDRAYVVNNGSSTVSTVDLVRGRVITTARVGFAPSEAALAPGGRTLWVTNTGIGARVGNTVSVLSTR